MAGTDKSQQFNFRPSPAVILCEPQLGENIGTAIRAMANFGLSELRIVDPRDGWPSEKAISAAAGADWIIESTRVYDRLEDALLDVNHAVWLQPALDPGRWRELFDLATAPRGPGRSEFGGNDFGLADGGDGAGG